ncbi:chorismate-binding protein [Streptomyces sp. B1I3]|uniref:chorismate-binding protein n=1 Tax=Streptomyces sp. B1I3 TaxID=3042264 RepID=UPI0027843567|nr:chorismate-binding protein [Streptomyces sp. B1I3]MDQ0793034.1 phenazine biosynthesis protein phzE [Streptomyces sp. B1I3]
MGPTDFDVTEGSGTRLLERLYGAAPPPFALLRRHHAGAPGPGPVEVFFGEMETVRSLEGIGAPDGARGPHALALLPFRQVAEHGLRCHDDGTPLRVLRISEHHLLPEQALTGRGGDEPVRWQDVGFTTDDAHYERLVREVATSDAARGGLNVLIRRDCTARLPGFRPAVAVELFRRLLTAESGAYWTFLVHTGGERPTTLVGATPQGHVSIENRRVVMNPLCGTYRCPPHGPRAGEVLAFLADRKESEELATTVDAELSVLCGLAGPDVRVEGPFLRRMAHLLHTQCRISGPAVLSAPETLSRALFASTTVGSPYAEACRAIHRHETTGRGYYGGLLALLGRDARGDEELDSAAVIRTLDIDHLGRARLSVGATIGSRSSPESEAAETRTKGRAVLTALTTEPAPPASRRRRGSGGTEPGAAAPGSDGSVREILVRRHAEFSSFWTSGGSAPTGRAGRVLVLDTGGEDLAALVHMVASVHGPPEVVRYDDPDTGDTLSRHRGPVLLASGPGRPDAPGSPRMAVLRQMCASLVRERLPGAAPVAGVGLGFQLLALAAVPDARVTARAGTGLGREVEVFGRPVTAAFRNTYALTTGPAGAAPARRGLPALCLGPDGRELIAMHGRAVRGVQFRPESVMTTDGAEVLRSLLG